MPIKIVNVKFQKCLNYKEKSEISGSWKQLPLCKTPPPPPPCFFSYGSQDFSRSEVKDYIWTFPDQ